MCESMDIIDYIKNKNQYFTIDVRSENEFLSGHIPGAVNLPLLTNEERKKVGTSYKSNGHYAAVLLGYELVSERFRLYINKIKKLSDSKPIAVYCARGGLRSTITFQLLKNAGLNVYKIRGGYKVFRKWTSEVFKVRKQVYIYGGYTGSAKTERLLEMKAKGYQVIDLEGLARHRGSAFGGIGMEPQPTVEHFENLLALEWMQLRSDWPVWLEDESRSIGRVFIPEPIFRQMREANLFKVLIPFEQRVSYIVSMYGQMDRESLTEATRQISKRLGGKRTAEAVGALSENRLDDWAAILLQYYDDQYNFGNGKRDFLTSFESSMELFQEYLKRSFPKPGFKVVLSLGGNMGEVKETFRLVKERLNAEAGLIIQESSLYKTQAWGDPDQPDFLNQVVVMLTTQKPVHMMNFLLDIEKSLGRNRGQDERKFGPRPIDLDILFYGKHVIELPELTVPHPKIKERRFILEPLKEVCPTAIHPVTGESFSSMLKNCTDPLRVEKLV